MSQSVNYDHHAGLNTIKDADEASDTKHAPGAESESDRAIQFEVDRRNFTRAVMLAQQYRHPQGEVRRLQEMALKQMACEYRNGIALRRLAQAWGFSRSELENLLTSAVTEHESRTDKVRSNLCYDATTGKYLTLRQWVEQFLNTKK